jgi:hypothetical protein
MEGLKKEWQLPGKILGRVSDKCGGQGIKLLL